MVVGEVCVSYMKYFILLWLYLRREITHFYKKKEKVLVCSCEKKNLALINPLLRKYFS